MTREEEIRKAVRAQIVAKLEDDLDGGELIMKEVYEELKDEVELAIAYDELRSLIEILTVEVEKL